MKTDTPENAPGFAIIGIGCRFPGSVRSPADFWSLLSGGIDAITEVPSDRFDLDPFFDPDPRAPGKTYSRWGGFIDRIQDFDADFFGIAPREARRMDPQHRVVLEVVWEALQDSGQVVERLAGSRVGVFAGISSHDYSDVSNWPAHRNLLDGHGINAAQAFNAANRVSRLLDLRGPSLALDTACSSSLTALHLACRSLASEDCELAIVASANAILTVETMITLCKAGVLSPDGKCKAFDARANGYVRGEGAGAIVLKPLTRAVANRDPIYAVIRATAAGQDGRTTALGIPSAAAQSAMFRQALQGAGIAPTAVQYLEAHGTGTAIGDPIEAEAIGQVFGRERGADHPCLIGSVKTNIGHLEAAAGIAGVIKAALALAHRQVPPSLHFLEPNPAIPFRELGLRLPTSLEPWPSEPGPAIAGVNSFGFGGAIAHVLLEEAPVRTQDRQPERTPPEVHLLPISARSDPALRELASRWVTFLSGGDRPLAASLQDACHTAAARRDHHEHRMAAVARSPREMAAILRELLDGKEAPNVAAGRRRGEHPPRIAFVYSGMGALWPEMGRQLLEIEPRFRAALVECDRLLAPLAGWSLIEEIQRPDGESRILSTDVAHVANFALQAALTALWGSWGIHPDLVFGHSSGEIGAAYAAGAVGLRDALLLAYHRGRLQDRLTGTGRMLAAGIEQHAAEAIVARVPGISIAAINSRSSVTLSGDAASLARVAGELERAGAFHRWLNVEVPYHSAATEAIRHDLAYCWRELEPAAGSVSLISAVTGRHMPGEALDASYWWRTVREPVRFADAVRTALESGSEVFLEVGPHPILSPSITQCLGEQRPDGKETAARRVVLPTLRRQADEREVLLHSLAALYASGFAVDWSQVFPEGDCISLPAYPWQRERHWFDPLPERDRTRRLAASNRKPAASAQDRTPAHAMLGTRLHAARPTWEVELGDERLKYFADHVIEDAIVFPAAGYVALAIGAAREIAAAGTDGPISLEDVQFQRMLSLSALDGATLQVLHDPVRTLIEVHSSLPAQSAWTLHACARVAGAASSATTTGCDSLAGFRAGCPTEIAADDHYRVLADHGMTYKGAFRSVLGLWRGSNVALARIGLPPGSPDSMGDGYDVHPALLDGAFQALAAAIDLRQSDLRGPFLPVSVRRLTMHARCGSTFWACAAIREIAVSGAEGDILLLDEGGNRVAELRGLRFNALERSSKARPHASLLYRVQWVEAPGTPIKGEALSPARLSAAIAPHIAEICPPATMAAYYERVEPALDALARRFAARALRQLGMDSEPDGNSAPLAIADRIGIAPSHHRLFTRILSTPGMAAALREDETARPVWDPSNEANDPVFERELALLKSCGERLRELLSGELDARQFLFGDVFDVLRGFYHSATLMRVYHDLAAEVLASAVASTPTALRVLEVGAGTGGLTATVLGRLPGPVAEYRFTDVSPYFTSSARAALGSYPYLQEAVLDIETDPVPQGLEPHSYDVLIASNVLHGTKDLRASLRNVRALLKPGGLLLLVENTRRPQWIDFIFGLLEGWWRHADTDVRPDHAICDQDRWLAILAEAGFESPVSLADPPRAGGTLQSVMLAREPIAAAGDLAHRPSARGSTWLMFADRAGVAPRLCHSLRERGDRCATLRPANRYKRITPDDYHIRPESDEDVARLVADIGGPIDGILFLWGLDTPWPSDATTADAMLASQRPLHTGIRSIVRGLEHAGPDSGTPRLWIVTAGAQPIDAMHGATHIGQAPLVGLGRVLKAELPAFRCRLVDLGPSCAPEEIASLVGHLQHGTLDPHATDDEIAFRGDRRFLPRIHAIDEPVTDAMVEVDLSPTAHSSRQAFKLEIGSRGTLSSLHLRATAAPAPGPGEVTIRVVAAGLNFRDVLMALGMPPFSAPALRREAGSAGEYSGVVVACGEGVVDRRPGDEVIAVTTSPFASHMLAKEEATVRKPANLSFEEAASIPIAFITAHYALDHLARITAGERVLIHCATGGVGLAAIQICRRVGAEIWATAGNEEKRDYLRSLGIEHVMDSRSLVFAEQVMEETGGQGVDVVLNSLSGPAIQKGLEILRPCGRFIEIGMRDIAENAALTLLPFRKNVSFFAVNLMMVREAFDGRLLRTVMQEISAGNLTPLPSSVFDIAAAESAFRMMAQARHIGKIVLAVQLPAYPVACDSAAGARIEADGTYLITGGLGGFGLAVAKWMVNRGARHLVLMSRTGQPKTESDDLQLQWLRNSPAKVTCTAADVANAADLNHVLSEIRRTSPPLRGVIHAAMVLDDGMLSDLDTARFEAVLAPKMAGAWNLHQQTISDPLDFFLLFSSISSSLGSPFQGNYVAANAFLDALPHYRRSRKLPASTIAWGALDETGYVARHAEILDHLDRIGLDLMPVHEATGALASLLDRDLPHAIASRSNWRAMAQWSPMVAASISRLVNGAANDAGGPPANPLDSLAARFRDAEPAIRSSLLVAHVVEKAARILEMSPDRLDSDRPLTDMGFDSLMAVELTTSLKLELGVPLGVARVLQGMSSRAVASAVEQHLAGEPAAVEATGGPAADGASSAPEDTGNEPAGGELSFEQKRFWFLDRLDPGSPACNLSAGTRLSGPLDVAALQKSIDEVVRRHEILRTHFVDVHGEPISVVAAPAPLPMRMVDLSSLAAEAQEVELERHAQAEAQRSFDLSAGPLLRMKLLRLEPHEHVLLIAFHHIIADAWAINLLVREIATLYEAFIAGAPSPLPDRVPQYREYVRQQRDSMSETVLEQDLAYWKSQLAGAAAGVPLPADLPANGKRSSRGGHVSFALTPQLSAQLALLCRQEEATLFTVLLVAFQTLLHRYSGTDDITIGTPVATRDQPGIETVIGCCMNTVALRTDLGGDPTFREAIRRGRRVTLGALEHARAPFERVVGGVSPPRAGTGTPLYRTMLVLHNFRMPPVRLPGLTLEQIEIETGIASCDLMLLIDSGAELHATLEYSTDLFTAEAASRIAGHFQTLLHGIVANPAARLSQLPVLTAADHPAAGWHETRTDFGNPCRLNDLFAAQVAHMPDHVAVVSEAGSMTYAELDRRSNQIARHLRSLGAGRNRRVAVLVERCPEAIVAALAVVKSGAAYVPIAADLPVERLFAILADADPHVVLTRERHRQRVDMGDRPIACLEMENGGSAAIDNRVEPGGSEDIAYILYTSGSTGAPVGVMIPHRAIVHQIQWRNTTFALTASDVVLQRTPLTFDPSIWEIFGALAAGALIALPPGSAEDPEETVRWIERQRVTTLQVVPTVLDTLLETPGIDACRSLSRVFCGGEVLPPKLVERFFARLPWAELYNLYGPTEAAIDATSWACRRQLETNDACDGGAAAVPIGHPIANTRVYVLDGDGSPVPAGIAGELAIGGVSLALGYWGQPELTARRFVADPLGTGPETRMFRTGDRARRRWDGAIEFLGRMDDQLKVNGVRIEPAEIEIVLRKHPAIREAAVVARRSSGHTELAAYVALHATSQLSTDEVRAFVLDRLPETMVPASVTFVDALPRSDHGKVDRRLLAQLIAPVPREPSVSARDEIEARLVRICEALLGASPIGIHDDFFAIGGTSLRATQLATRIREGLGHPIPVADIFRYPTVAALAQLIRGGNPSVGRVMTLQVETPDSVIVLSSPTNGSRTTSPWILIHGLTGDVACYAELARRMDDGRPILGIQAAGPVNGDEPPATIEEMAARHVGSIRAVQPQGPYLLAGWSMGGVVAYETARQLVAMGGDVQLLVLLDSSLTPPEDLLSEEDMSAYLRRLTAGLGSSAAGQTGQEEGERMTRLARHHLTALRAYQPRPLSRLVTLIRAEGTLRVHPDPMLGWRFPADGVNLDESPGDHESMLRIPHVTVLARKMSELAQRAELR